MIRRFLPALLALVVLPLALYAADSITDLGFDDVQVQNSLFYYLRGWASSPTVPSAVRALPTEQKVAAVKTLGAFARTYFASDGFKKDYAKAYKEGKPKTGFGLPKISLSDIAARATDKALDKATGTKPTGLDKDPNVQLERRLQAFLDVTADVDFDAKTTGSGSNRRFADEKYEAKPNEWKMCFRAGPEVTKEVRSFAEQWIAELK